MEELVRFAGFQKNTPKFIRGERIHRVTGTVPSPDANAQGQKSGY